MSEVLQVAHSRSPCPARTTYVLSRIKVTAHQSCSFRDASCEVHTLFRVDYRVVSTEWAQKIYYCDRNFLPFRLQPRHIVSLERGGNEEIGERPRTLCSCACTINRMVQVD